MVVKKYFVKLDVRRKVGSASKTVSVKGPWSDSLNGAIRRAQEYLHSKGWPLEALHAELHESGDGVEDHKGAKHRLTSPLDLLSCGLKPQ